MSTRKNSANPSGINVLARMVGEKVPGQCLWGFVNGIRNRKEDALKSCELISKKTGNEQVIAFQNDQFLQGVKEVGVALILKMGFDAPVVTNAAHYLRHLLSLSESKTPVVVFAHSQGAAIVEHALRLLSQDEREKIRVFTFGGWSFIPPGAAHPESHNYASAADLIPRIGSYNHQYLALKRHEAMKENITCEEMIWRLSFTDALRELNCLDPSVLEKYAEQRSKHYAHELEKISNVTILEPARLWEHSFSNPCYQEALQQIIEKYQRVENIKEESVVRH